MTLALDTSAATWLRSSFAEEIGCLRRVSTATVRQQIKCMLSKTRASRLSDMVRLFYDAAAGSRADLLNFAAYTIW